MYVWPNIGPFQYDVACDTIELFFWKGFVEARSRQLSFLWIVGCIQLG